jgi:MFS transporter, AAHS family, 4-hydroxybenzoate transporter
VVGSLSAGPLADRFGRKTILSISVLIFGLACLASAFSAGLNQLVAWRFITGVGLGAAMPNAVTMMNEYCPEARRATLTNAMFCGFPLGAAFGGFVAAWIIPHFGWRSVLLLGGIAPLFLGVLILFVLPESVRYMVAKNYPAERIREALRRVQPTAAEFPLAMTGMSGATQELARARSSIGVVLSKELLVGSVMLWLAYFMGLVIFYALINWMPVLLKDAGVAPSTAALVSALFPLGGFGAILSGWLMDRFNANLIIAACFALTAAAVYAIGQSTGNIVLLMLVVLGAGTIMNTAQSSLPTLAAAFYPTNGRATGVAWMMGIGRFGGIAGSFLVAELSRRNLSFGQIFMIVAISGLVAAAALVIKQLAHPETKSDYNAAQGEVLGH